MRLFSLLFCLLALSGVASAQYLLSALHLNENREYKTARPKRIVETNTFYNPGFTRTETIVKAFDGAGMLLTEERYDQASRLKARFSYRNDTATRRVLSKEYEGWTPYGHSKEAIIYTYDRQRYLVGITELDTAGKVVMQTTLQVNAKGHPVELLQFVGNGNLYRKETAIYLYDRNKVVTSRMGPDNRVFLTDTTWISYRSAHLFKEEGDVFNAAGDAISWRANTLKGPVEYEEEYAYDEKGNCTENRIYTVTVERNGKRKRTIDRVFKKEYTY
jgi:hypothetical protein